MNKKTITTLNGWFKGWFLFKIDDKRHISFNEAETACYNENYNAKDFLLNNVDNEREIASMIYELGKFSYNQATRIKDLEDAIRTHVTDNSGIYECARCKTSDGFNDSRCEECGLHELIKVLKK